MNAGAQTCVIHRVKKNAAVVRERSSGGNDIAAACTKSRVWSIVMSTMTRPRRRSTDETRLEVRIYVRTARPGLLRISTVLTV